MRVGLQHRNTILPLPPLPPLLPFLLFLSPILLSHLPPLQLICSLWLVIISQTRLDASIHSERLYMVVFLPMKYDIPTLLALSRNARIDIEKFSSQAASSPCILLLCGLLDVF